jgi:hypothetical protein
MVYFNNVNNNVNKNVVNISKDRLANHPFVVIFLFGLLFFTIIYILYYYFRKNQPIPGMTYYSSDIMKMDPLFNKTAVDMNDCIEHCNKELNCDGVTYNIKNKACIGQYEGRLRSDTSEYIAWVKTKSSNLLNKTGNLESTKQSYRIVPLLSSTNKSKVPISNIPNPVFPDHFTYSFWINIKDWYHNYSYWRHIFHKGSPFDKSVKSNGFKTFKYRNWEEITDNLPEQCIGAWLTPFQNNIRIAITTVSDKYKPEVYSDANVQKCECTPDEATKSIHCSNCWITDQQNDVKYSKMAGVKNLQESKIEYIDIPDIETNKPTNIVVSVKGLIVEIFMNNKFIKTIVLSGSPNWNTGDLYVHNPVSYSGELKDLLILPGTSNLQIVNDLYKNKNIQSKDI